MIPAGTRLAFEVRGTAGGWIPTSVDALHSEIVQELSALPLSVESVTIAEGGEIYEVLEWPFTARIVVVTRNAHAKAEDVAAIVQHGVIEATGNAVAIGGAGSQAGDPRMDPGGLDIFGGIGSLLGGIQREANFVLILVAVILIVLVVRVGGKTTRVGVAL